MMDLTLPGSQPLMGTVEGLLEDFPDKPGSPIGRRHKRPTHFNIIRCDIDMGEGQAEQEPSSFDPGDPKDAREDILMEKPNMEALVIPFVIDQYRDP